ncbi:hypothetical protein GALMADRAFT_56773 [Galerina marginata CBS 339.88]|uniref:Crinkler effector protein N-terminal domain-containing protein n=1 Tax=Galerina marginata (strain CBS 339.88) TaxID=685588 RepID=A0A067TJV2_GALM3|nr:hypothetical protein GALMADRAFT_56773 [Galerina marginata CBS 339.88]
MSTLESVVGSEYLADWLPREARPTNSFVHFHQKFWGKPEEEGLGVHEDGDGSKLYEMGAEDFMVVDDSTDESEPEDGDIGSRCYALDVERNYPGTIWVRNEYIRVFEFAESFYSLAVSSRPDAPAPAPCLIVTGQPGIGKSVWQWYALRVCCGKRRPVILYSGGECWLFVDEGVFMRPPDFGPDLYQSVIWTLVGSVDTGPDGLPVCFKGHATRHFIIYTTPLTPSNWAKIDQFMTRKIVMMNPWTKAEIYKAASYFPIPTATIDQRIHEFGFIPRRCFQLQEVDLDDDRRCMVVALDAFTLDDVDGLAFREYLSLDSPWDLLFLLRRKDAGLLSTAVSIEPISSFVECKFFTWMRSQRRRDLVHLFNRFVCRSATQKLAGCVFKAYCHVVFSLMIEFDPLPMARDADELTATKEGSGHEIFYNKKGPQQTLEGLGPNSQTLVIKPRRSVNYCSASAACELDIQEEIYYIPLKANQIGIDSFILHDSILYLFQITVSTKPGIKDALLPFLKSLSGLPPQSNWHVIFVKPPFNVLECPVPKSTELQSLKLFSAEVKVTSGEPEIEWIPRRPRTMVDDVFMHKVSQVR